MMYQINWHAKPDLMVVVPDLYDRRCRRRRQKLARRQHPGPQGPTYMDILYIKMILMPSPTSWLNPTFGRSPPSRHGLTCLKKTDPPDTFSNYRIILKGAYCVRFTGPACVKGNRDYKFRFKRSVSYSNIMPNPNNLSSSTSTYE